MLHQHNFVLDGQDANGHLREFSWFEPDQQVSVHQIQVYVLYNQIMYTLTATHQADSPEDQHQNTFQHMIETFAVN